MTDPTRPRAWWRVGALALTAALAAAACSTTTPAQKSEPTRTGTAMFPTSAGPSASASTPAQLALAAYTAMWGDVQAAGATSNYQDPRLAAHLGGKALLTVSENMAADQAHGIVELGTPVPHPRVLTATASTATLADCLDDTGWLTYYAATRALTDTVPGGHRYVTATVTDENGTWKVTTLDTRGEGTC